MQPRVSRWGQYWWNNRGHRQGPDARVSGPQKHAGGSRRSIGASDRRSTEQHHWRGTPKKRGRKKLRAERPACGQQQRRRSWGRRRPREEDSEVVKSYITNYNGSNEIFKKSVKESTAASLEILNRDMLLIQVIHELRNVVNLRKISLKKLDPRADD